MYAFHLGFIEVHIHVVSFFLLLLLLKEQIHYPLVSNPLISLEAENFVVQTSKSSELITHGIQMKVKTMMMGMIEREGEHDTHKHHQDHI